MTRKVTFAMMLAMGALKFLRLLVGGLFVLVLPALLLSSTLRYLINEPRLYQWGFARQRVAAATGLGSADLERVGRELIAYFNSSEEPLSVRVTLGGEERELFNPREVVHMRDVKGLIQGVFRVQEASLAVVAGFVIGAGFWLRRALPKTLARLTLGGTGLGIGVLAAFGLATLLGFDRLFLWFHLLSFSNLFWMLDPRTDYLIRLFPPAFFMESALLLAGATLLEAMVLAGLSWAYLRRRRRSEVAALAASAGATGAATSTHTAGNP